MLLRVRNSRLLFPLLIVSFYILSRLAFAASGIRFDMTLLDLAWQNLDVVSLQNDLARSVFYQHSQPPLFNFLLGVVLKLFPESYPVVFELMFHVCGLVIFFLLFKILRHFEFGSWGALAIAAIFSISPEAILYENWLFYTWPIATLLTFATYVLLRYQATRLPRYAALFILSIAVLCLTRSMFHLVYLGLCLALVLSIRTTSQRRRTIGMFSVCSLGVVGSVYLKNLLIFGFFGTSSWLGMNLYRVVNTDAVSSEAADTEVTSVRTFSSMSDYPKRYRGVPATFSEIPALTTEHKKVGYKNLNHYGYVRISREYMAGALSAIKSDPGYYLRNVAVNWVRYYPKPGWSIKFMTENSGAIEGYINVTSLAGPRFFIERNVLGFRKPRRFPLSSLLILLGALFLVVVNVGFHFVRFAKSGEHAEHLLILGFMVLTILYVAIVGNLVEHGENNRFRVETDPLLYLAVMIVVRDIWRAAAAKRWLR